MAGLDGAYLSVAGYNFLRKYHASKPAMTATLKRRWFQFSLKGMLVVMTLACAGLGWLAYGRNEVKKREVAIAAIEKLGGTVHLDSEKPFRPKWLGPLLGDKSAGEVVDVFLQGTQVTDAGLVHLKGLTNLKLLYLSGTQVTDNGLVHLKGLTKLEKLYLRGTGVTDAGLEHLKGLTNLTVLSLDPTQVSEQGVSDLKKALPNTFIER